jgi:hypothetical protein
MRQDPGERGSTRSNIRSFPVCGRQVPSPPLGSSPFLLPKACCETVPRIFEVGSSSRRRRHCCWGSRRRRPRDRPRRGRSPSSASKGEAAAHQALAAAHRGATAAEQARGGNVVAPTWRVQRRRRDPRDDDHDHHHLMGMATTRCGRQANGRRKAGAMGCRRPSPTRAPSRPRTALTRSPTVVPSPAPTKATTSRRRTFVPH